MIKTAPWLLTALACSEALGAPRPTEPAAVMAGAARNFLASLSPTQRAQTVFPFEAEERMNWHYVPRERKGIGFKELDSSQRHLAHGLLSAGLSQRGYLKATTIMSLEEVLRVLEGGRGPARDPELYYFTLFGEPSETQPWAWRVEGHHLSINITVVKERLIASTPQFLGANPAEVREGSRKGLRALHREEDLARELLHALDAKQRGRAVIEETAPRDIITGNARKADIGTARGLPVAAMNSGQRTLVLALLEEYATTMPDPVAQERLETIRKAGLDKIYFAWAGGPDRGQPHYYRLQGPTFLIEYDNTQNQANHIHSVWRDFDGDWGLDLLRLHYETAPHKHGH